MTSEHPQERPEPSSREAETNDLHREVLKELRELRREMEEMKKENLELRTQVDILTAANERLQRCADVTRRPAMPHLRGGRVEYPALRDTDLMRRAPSRTYARRFSMPTYVARSARSRIRTTARSAGRRYEYMPYRNIPRQPEIGRTRNRWTKEKGSFTEQYMGPEQGWQTIAILKTPVQHELERARVKRREAEKKEEHRQRSREWAERMREWDLNRNNPVWKDRKNAERRLKERFGEDALKRTSAPDIAYRMHLARSGIAYTKENATSAFIDSTRSPLMNRESRNAAEILSKIPYDYERYTGGDQRFGNIRDYVKSMQAKHDKLRRDWDHLPPAERYYRAMSLRTDREELEKITRQHEAQSANRDRLKYRFTLHTEEVPVPRTGAAVRIMLPPGITSFDQGRAREIVYYPNNNTFRGSDLAIANEAGLVFENAPAGVKNGLGAEAVRGVYVHFKRPGTFYVNGKMVDVIRPAGLEKHRDENNVPDDRMANPWHYRRDVTGFGDASRNGRAG